MTSLKARRPPAAALATVFFIMLLSACGPQYKYHPLPAKKPGQYPGHVTAGSLELAAEAWNNPAEIRKLFGFDPRRAGVKPIQVVVENTTDQTQPFYIMDAKITDSDGQWWDVLPREIAQERIGAYTRGETHTGRNLIKFALAGAAVGVAWAITGDSNVAVGLGKGAAIGAATGVVVSAFEDRADDPAHKEQVAAGLARHSLPLDNIPPQGLRQGILFFPGEMGKPQSLSLTLRNPDSGKNQLRVFKIYFD